MKKHSLLMTLAMITLIAISLPPPAAAKDAVTAAVTPLEVEGEPTPVVMENGNPYSHGTFALGTIQLFYTVDGTEFPTGHFASFTLDLDIKPGPTTGQSTRYPVEFLTLEQIGSQNLELQAALDSFVVVDADWSAQTTVDISIASWVPDDPSLNCDGCELVGNLRLVTPGGSHLDTVTNIQVHIMLVHPTACLRVFNFLTDNEFTTILDSVEVSVSNSKKNGPEIKGTNPGQLSDNVLVVNNCAQPQTFDLQINLDSHFEVKGNNAVATYLAGGYIDPSNFDIDIFGEGTKHGQNLLLTEITLPPASSFLATVHIGLITGGSPDTLPASGLFEEFLDELLVPGTSGTLAPPILFTLADPNPATATLGFTIK